MKNRIWLKYTFNHIILTILSVGFHAQSFAAAAPSAKSYDTLTQLGQAAIQGDFDTVHTIVENDPAVLLQKNNYGWIPLHFAAKHGHYELAQYLIGKNSTSLAQQTDNGWTPLHMASAYGYLNIVELIFEVDPSIYCQKNNQGLIPLAIAAVNEHHDIVQYMVQAANGHTPLHEAASSGHLEIVQYLIENDPNSVAQKNKNGWTPLHMAVARGHLKIVQCIVEKDPTTIAQEEKLELPLLDIAIMQGHSDIAKYLINSNPSMLSRQNSKGYSPLLVATINGRDDIVQYITGINGGHTLLHEAAQYGHVEIAKWIILNDPRSLIRQDSKGLTPDLVAAINKQYEIVQFITEINGGHTPLHVAAKKNYIKIAKDIVEADPASVIQKTVNGFIPLHVAVANGNIALAKYFIEKNPTTITQKNEDGWTPLHIAATLNDVALVDFMLQADNFIDFRVKTSGGENIFNLISDDKKKQLINVLRSHLLRLNEAYSDEEHIQCAVCLEMATQCSLCPATKNPLERIVLTPCCLKVLCLHDITCIAQSGNLTCPCCRNSWKLSQ